MPPTRADGRHLLRRHRLAAHAFGQAGGARRIEHRRAADRCVLQRRVRVTPKVPIGHAVGNLCQRRRNIEGGGDFRRRRHHQQFDIAGQAMADLRQQVGMADQDFGAAVGQDIGDFLRLQMPVDRHHRAAQRRRSNRDFEERKIVAQHHPDRHAATETERPKARRRPRDAGVDLGIADPAFAADDRCQFFLPALFLQGRGRKALAVVQNVAEGHPALAVEAAQPQLLERQVILGIGRYRDARQQ